ncbi:uncharacterized protein PF11_0207 isoform X2 [Chelonus insularis]|uniref:uncharacterized protein PF11_0207 isoform X2 n=1 Tax=Chelonus insularis TaxID=460826 RepID=UPI00158DB7C9|nr:uncharacterized protein PF11_0207 isoform X2 [Chelonus insularis]
MSISQDNSTTIVCREVFDETSPPSNEEILDYAKKLGIDPDTEPHLLDLAREGLMAALPKGWSPCFHEASGAWYYYQASTGTTRWEHPLDAKYKKLVEHARASKSKQHSLDDRHMDEERKSVRFDLEKHPEDIKFTYSDSEEENWDSEMTTSKSDHKNQINKKEVKDSQNSTGNQSIHGEIADIENEVELEMLKKKALQLINDTPKIIANRFFVQNVSETEHLSQISKDSQNDNEYLPTNKFGNIKNIDLFSKSDTDSTPRTSSEETGLHQVSHLSMTLKTDTDVIKEVSAKKEIYKQSESEIVTFKKELEEKLNRTKLEMEANFIKQKNQMEKDLENRLKEFKNQLHQKEQDEIKKLVAEMDEARRKNLEKVRAELESCYEKERQEIFEKLKIELDEKKQELLELRNREIEKMENEFDQTVDEEKALKLAEHEITQKHNEKIEEMKKELEKEFDDLRNELRAQQREKMMKITEDNEKCLAEIVQDFRTEESTARKVYKQRLEEIRADFSRDIEKEMKKLSERAAQQETANFDKIRCEKRLLEDKYKTLKEKYLKLKNDVRLAVERRSKRREGNTTASETERSASTRTKTERTESSLQRTSSKNASTNFKVPDALNSNIADNSESQRLSRLHKFSHGDSRSGKLESDDTTTVSETMNSNTLKKKKIFAKKTTSTPKNPHNSNNNNNNSNNNNNNNITDNPVENIRKQLEKLEDLGDQLPTNENAYTLRYPFQDKVPVSASSELEFFRHRIHVERDSVKRARETLKAQQNIFQDVQKAWKERCARATLEQLVQEERDLSDMEVSLHRTKSLLGEKVIHLKHLEQSLERVANAKKNEAEAAMLKNDELTLSDISSASSGFSSTDLDKPDYYQESTEIIANLEKLNSDIREIWSVLKKSRGNTVPPPPSLVYSDLRWSPYQHLTTQSNNIQGFGTPNIQSNILSQLTTPPTTTTQNIIAQYGPTSGFTTSVGTVERGSSNLIERTRNMRDWLRQARIETNNLISSGQATL